MLMNMIQLPQRPNVEVSRDLKVIDDRFADRIVEQMRKALSFDLHELLNDTYRMAMLNGHSLGNPKGQTRYFNRLTATLGRAVLFSHLRTGTSKRFYMAHDFWSPLGVGMECIRLEAMGSGAGRPVDSGISHMFAMSHHALSKLVQRAGCQTPEDLVAMIRKTWTLLQWIVLSIDETGIKPPTSDESGWLLPVQAANGEFVYFVLTRDKDGLSPVFVPTVLARKMLPNPDAPFQPLFQLMDDLIQGRIDRDAKEVKPLFIETLKETAKASRRGRAA